MSPRPLAAPSGGLFAQLKALGAHGGTALGDAYAWVATAYLNQLERREDLAAERRYAQRVQARRLPGPTASPRSK